MQEGGRGGGGSVRRKERKCKFGKVGEEGRRTEVRIEERKILKEIHIANHLQEHGCSAHVQCRLARLVVRILREATLTQCTDGRSVK